MKRRKLNSPAQKTMFAGQSVIPKPLPVGLTQSWRDDSLGDRPADDVGAAEPECAFGRRIEVNDLTFGIHRYNTVERRFDDGALARFAGPGRRLRSPQGQLNFPSLRGHA